MKQNLINTKLKKLNKTESIPNQTKANQSHFYKTSKQLNKRLF